jgi:hypothetical protein
VSGPPDRELPERIVRLGTHGMDRRVVVVLKREQLDYL